jgi:MFS transporter, BCD family, chlorophyll transporter
MKRLSDIAVGVWSGIAPRFLPFADAATAEVPLSRLLRLSLFQVSAGMAIVMLNGTLNRVMIVELGVPGSLVAIMVSLPLVFAPLRALIGHRSDVHRSALGWRRVPYIWLGTMLQFGGFAILPFALLVLSGDGHGPAVFGKIGAALAFLLIGAGLHTAQTAGLALATDLATPATRPRVVAFMYVMLLVGMLASALVFGALLADFGPVKLIQVIQGAALATFALNVVALWKQEARNPARTDVAEPPPPFRSAWRAFATAGRTRRALSAVGFGTAAFSMQDILLEPYGGQILNLSVASTTLLTAILAIGTLAGFALAARALMRGLDPYRLAGLGAVLGVFAFSAVIFSAPLASPFLLQAGTLLIGLGGGLFSVGTMTAVMDLARDGQSGIALGAWGAVQATTAGLAIAFGGIIRDLGNSLATAGHLGSALTDASTGYLVVYHIEIGLLFVTLVAIGPLVNARAGDRSEARGKFGLSEFPA